MLICHASGGIKELLASNGVLVNLPNLALPCPFKRWVKHVLVVLVVELCVLLDPLFVLPMMATHSVSPYQNTSISHSCQCD